MRKSFILVLLLFFGAHSAYAQQSIFNVPSADVTPKGRVFTEAEFQFRPWNPGRNMLNTDYAAVGIGHNTELDMTLFNVSAPASNNITLGTGFKSVIPVLIKKLPNQELKIIGGTMVLASLEGQGVGNWSYCALSGRVPKVKTRLTAGVSYGTKQIFGKETVAFIGGIEQPLTKRLGLQVDWYSGTEHFAGFLISGFSYELPHDTAIYAGYQIPNSPKNGFSGFAIELAKLF